MLPRGSGIIVVSLLLAWAIPVAVAADDAADSAASFTCLPWEEGQKMFYTDPYWRGGDCASTVDLGDGRVLWLFADSWVGVKPPYVRDSCCVHMIRNCMGIQHGYDPATADFRVHWRGTREEPRAFFAGEEDSWFWPGNGVMIDGVLVVFLMRVCPSDSGLGFVTCGHAAFIIDSFDGNPDQWSLKRLALPENSFGIMLGAATLVEPPYLYAFSTKEPGDHSMYLARWLTDSILAGSADAIEWWTGDSTAWVPHSSLTSLPTALFLHGASEFSVVHDASTDQYLSVQMVGFGAIDVTMRTAPALTGPWSDLQLVYQPLEKAKPGVMMYAAKVHPEIIGADLVITYNTNASHEMLIADSTLYYPRLLRFDWND